MQTVIDIDDKLYERITVEKEYYLEDGEDLCSAIENGVPLPKGHGALIDISNIDVIVLEDSIHFIRHEKGDDVDVYIGAPIIIEANKAEIPTGSTTKNDLGVDCISRQELLKIYEDRFFELQKLKHLKDNKGAEDRQMGINYCINILKELPPVTPQEPMLNKLKEQDEPKAVRYEGDGYADGSMVYDYAYCPNCNHETEVDSENWGCDFCPNCGQRLRW